LSSKPLLSAAFFCLRFVDRYSHRNDADRHTGEHRTIFDYQPNVF